MTKLYVGNLNSEITSEVIKQQFQKYFGKVEEVKLIRNRHSENNYAFVKMQKMEDSEKALREFQKYINYNWTVYKSNDSMKDQKRRTRRSRSRSRSIEKRKKYKYESSSRSKSVEKKRKKNSVEIENENLIQNLLQQDNTDDIGQITKLLIMDSQQLEKLSSSISNEIIEISSNQYQLVRQHCGTGNICRESIVF